MDKPETTWRQREFDEGIRKPTESAGLSYLYFEE